MIQKRLCFPIIKDSVFQGLPKDFTVMIALHPFYRNGTMVSWGEVQSLIGFNSLESLGNVMLKSIGAIKNDSTLFIEKFDQRLEELHIEYPEEGEIPKEVLDKLVSLFHQYNEQKIIIWSEQGFEKKVVDCSLQEVQSILSNVDFSHGVISNQKESFFVMPFWDGFYSFVLTNDTKYLSELNHQDGIELISFNARDTIYFGE